MFDQPHRRYNPLLGEWVLVSPHRTQRPWQGAQEEAVDDRPQYDPTCYLCPGNTRSNGEVNPDYPSTFTFVNDFSALLPETPWGHTTDPLFQARSVRGECRVICFSPRHDLTLSQMSQEELESVVELWNQQYVELHETYQWVQIFENRGAAMGASNPHPHGQVWASSHTPSLVEQEDGLQMQYFDRTGSPMLCDYVSSELEKQERIVVETKHWVWLVPFWATWPYEIMLLPKAHRPIFTDLTSEEKCDLASILSIGLKKYDALFNCSFPYSMGWHGGPNNGEPWDHWQLHAHFFPPLLRSATVKKFMVGYEMLGESQRDITPEQAAQRLRECG